MSPLLCSAATSLPSVTHSRVLDAALLICCHFRALAPPGTLKAVFVLLTVSALVEPKALGQALGEALWGLRRRAGHGPCLHGAHGLVGEADLQLTTVVLKQRGVPCVVCLQGRGADDYDGGGDHWEDGTHRVSAHRGLKVFDGGRCFRQREWH